MPELYSLKDWECIQIEYKILLRGQEIDISNRNKDYTWKATIGKQPATDEQMSATISLLDYVKERRITIETTADLRHVYRTGKSD